MGFQAEPIAPLVCYFALARCSAWRKGGEKVAWRKGDGFIYSVCGDDFANLFVEREKKTLLSTYWKMNEPMLCVTNFSPD